MQIYHPDMNRLLIMRHGKSDWYSNAGSDFERPLAKRGVKTAGKIGNWILQNSLSPDIIVSSPALRAKSTARIMCEAFKRPETDIVYDERIYNADVDNLLAVITDHVGKESVLLIGHNPGLDELLDYLSNEKPGRNKNGKLMTTAAVAILVYDDPEEVTRQAGAKLEKLVRPKDL